MQKGRSIGSKLWNWQPIKNRTRRLEILKNRKIKIYTKKIETSFSEGRQNLTKAAKTL